MPRALRSFGCRWRPTSGSPTVRRILHEESCDNRHDQICNAEIREGTQHANSLNQPRRYRCRDQSTSSKSTNRDAGNKSSAIRKPFYQDRHRNNVAKPKTDSPDQSIAEVQPPELMRGEAGEKHSEAIERSSRQRNDARSRSTYPQAANERGDP